MAAAAAALHDVAACLLTLCFVPVLLYNIEHCELFLTANDDEQIEIKYGYRASFDPCETMNNEWQPLYTTPRPQHVGGETNPDTDTSLADKDTAIRYCSCGQDEIEKVK